MNLPAPTLAYLDRLAQQRFYGSVTLRFEDGRIVHLRTEQSLLPTDLAGMKPEERLDQHHSG